jgi:hypothetical protein
VASLAGPRSFEHVAEFLAAGSECARRFDLREPVIAVAGARVREREADGGFGLVWTDNGAGTSVKKLTTSLARCRVAARDKDPPGGLNAEDGY